MDAVAWRIRELVVEACAVVRAAEDGAEERAVGAELEHLRVRLLALAEETSDTEAADAACGVVGDINAALCRVGAPIDHRGAA